jgi:hypothetical protein
MLYLCEEEAVLFLVLRLAPVSAAILEPVSVPVPPAQCFS